MPEPVAANTVAAPQTLALIVRRTIRAPVARVFAAWTRPEDLRRWWGPSGVSCPDATVDLRPGGTYRIGNLLPDGQTLWITGEFEEVSPPDRLVYTWGFEHNAHRDERVTVRFEAREGGTEVIVVHERISDPAVRASHEAGWIGCLEGLEEMFQD